MDAKFYFLVLWMLKIVECEGGEVEVYEEGGKQRARLRSVIPAKNWCERCNSLMKRVAEMQDRWNPGSKK